MKNPYNSAPASAFWRTGVADVAPWGLSDLYKKTFPIGPTDRIVTAGSCFAQHIGRHMRKAGFRFKNYEPAPPMFPKKLRGKFNYGVFSARYCNIYTARQLVQLFDRAFDIWSPHEDLWNDSKGWYDAFRPAVEPMPFASREEAIASRQSHFRAVRKVFKESDVFIFTLGLTEAWISKADEAVYPVCPGVHGGAFDSQKYAFKNFDYEETLADMRSFVSKVRDVNPRLKILLTVSPVPLTATASNKHVMVATTYSKSVLRAVAGKLADEDEQIDYFPSYEIISSPAMNGVFFEANKRSVAALGVDYVMSHFFAEHPPLLSAVPTKTNQNAVVAGSDDDLICEEMLLEGER
ncbi:GSCFA domain-containing protein [Pseudorhodoplanes sp.]|uniref:GSCFA domain-containing protein n=1 Tax=Pseudorhodoplanes sp. TaxID=1934341 RepID=UPI002C3D6EEE|nr:GSCFA domain-containing protein [Pseudorhodoplanes sp.]HWV52805.1 GSCFA domain-containing protein [Pseudorhodoplanes sp.]